MKISTGTLTAIWLASASPILAGHLSRRPGRGVSSSLDGEAIAFPPSINSGMSVERDGHSGYAGIGRSPAPPGEWNTEVAESVSVPGDRAPTGTRTHGATTASQPASTVGEDSGIGLEPTSSSPTNGATGTSNTYMDTVNKWRDVIGLSALIQDDKLQTNAQDASNSAGGQLRHKLNPGTIAQVMAEGNEGNFESVFVGGWLCELPDLPGLGSAVCNEMAEGWDHAGQTGHAKILSDSAHSKIGCALGTGIWTCDLA